MSILIKNFLLRFVPRRTYVCNCRRMSYIAAASSAKMKLIWIDMEMSGLDIEHDKILEIACILTDTTLTEKVDGPLLFIHQTDKILNAMGTWCKEQHTKTGLVEECKKSKITESDADELVLDFISKYIPYNEGVMAGNTIYMDKIFLQKFLPRVYDYMHHRVIDVSSIKELCRWWLPQTYIGAPQKKVCHRALDDIKESLEELKYYKHTIFDLVVEKQMH